MLRRRRRLRGGSHAPRHGGPGDGRSRPDQAGRLRGIEGLLGAPLGRPAARQARRVVRGERRGAAAAARRRVGREEGW